MIDETVKVLVVEDSPTDAMVLKAALARTASPGFELFRAERLAEGVQLCRDQRPHVVLLDLGLPDSQGVETLQAFLARVPDVPVVVLTGIDDEALGIRLLKVGAQDYLAKGQVNSELLVRTIRYAVERSRADAALRLSEIRFRALIERVSDTIVILDQDGIIEYVSPAIRLLGDLEPAELLGANFRTFYGPDEQAEAEDLLARVLAQPALIHRHERRYRRQGGAFSTLDVTVQNLLTLPAVGGIVASLRDVTERNQAEQALHESQRLLREANTDLEQKVALRTRELQAAKERAEAADRLKSQFLANMSHELRTPLNAIIGFTGALLMHLSGGLNDKQEEQLTIVQASAKHLLSLINDLLDLAKIESGKMQVRIEPVACRALLSEVLSMMQPLAEKKGLDLSLDAPQGDVRIVTDQRALKQIVVNLCNNAIKFTDTGSVRIELRAPTADHPAEICVLDTGIGIRDEDREKLFRVFPQMDNGDREGTGLGLHLSQKLAHLIRANIQFSSAPGRGSRFWLTLPPE